MTKSTVATSTTKNRKPKLNAYLLQSITKAAESIVAEILEIDFLLLAYKRELACAQQPVNGALVLNFLPSKNAEGFEDTEPVMAKYVMKEDGSWMVRVVISKPGCLHLARAKSRSGGPLNQDAAVKYILTEIDVLIQARKKLIALCRPIRQNANGAVKGSEKTRRIAVSKIHKASLKITIDWTRPGAATIAATREQEAKDERAKRKSIKKAAADTAVDAGF